MATLTYTPADSTVVSTVGPFLIYSDYARTVLAGTTSQPVLTGPVWVAPLPGGLANGTYYPNVPVTYTDGSTVPDTLPPIVLPAGTLVSLSEVKAQLNYLTAGAASPDDAELQTYLDAALDVAPRYVGPLVAQTYTETHYDVRNLNRIQLDRLPVIAVQSVSVLYALGVTPMAYTGADMLLDPATGMLRFARGLPMYGDITVTYTAGPPALSPAVRRGIVMLAAYWWQQTQLGPRGQGAGVLGQGGGDTYNVQPGPDFGIPDSVLVLWRAKRVLAGMA